MHLAGCIPMKMFLVSYGKIFLKSIATVLFPNTKLFQNKCTLNVLYLWLIFFTWFTVHVIDFLVFFFYPPVFDAVDLLIKLICNLKV